MKKFIVLLALFFVCNIVYAESIIEYDPDNAIVSNRVVKYLKSMDSGPYMETPNCVACPIANHLIDASLASVDGVPRRHWKVSSGSVVEMSQPEKDYITSVANTEAAAAEVAAIATFDSNITSTDVSEYNLTKIDNYIDNIENVADVRAAFKKIMRFVARMHK